MGALGFQFVSPEAATAWVNRYYLNLTTKLDKLAAYATNPNIAMVCGFMCAETDEIAMEKALGWTFFMWDKYQEWRETPKAQEALRTGLIGSPETIRRRLREYERTNVDQVILLNQSGKTLHEDICASLELFAREVMPEFHDREDEHQAWKRGVLNGDVRLDDIDIAPHQRYLAQPDSHVAQSQNANDLKKMLDERDRARAASRS